MTIKRGDTVVRSPGYYPVGTRQNTATVYFGTYCLGFIFWLAGVLCWFFVRPGDVRRTLLTIFFFSNAIFIVPAAYPPTHLFYSATLARSLTWLLIPIYFHLHWYFPQRLGALNPGVIIALYYVGFAMAVAEMFHTLPDISPNIALFLAFGSSVILLLVHAWRSPEQRGDIILMAVSGIAYLAGSILFFFTGRVSEPGRIGIRRYHFFAACACRLSVCADAQTHGRDGNAFQPPGDGDHLRAGR